MSRVRISAVTQKSEATWAEHFGVRYLCVLRGDPRRWEPDIAMGYKARLHKLCSQALREEDPRKLAVLLREIESEMSQLITDVQEILKEVSLVLQRKSLPRIH